MNELFILNEGFKQGAQWHKWISERITGRIACDATACGIIAQAIVSSEAGDHLEIGTLFGGTAILAAKIKREKGDGGKVVVIDPLDGYYDKGKDPITKLAPDVRIFEENMSLFGVVDKVELHAVVSNPLPVEGPFVTALIDGDHSYEGCLADWLNVKEITSRYVIFDNVDKNYQGVVKVFSQACSSEGWRPVLLLNGVGVVERTA